MAGQLYLGQAQNRMKCDYYMWQCMHQARSNIPYSAKLLWPSGAQQYHQLDRLLFTKQVLHYSVHCHGKDIITGREQIFYQHT